MALERESKPALDGELDNYKWDVFLIHDTTPNAFSVGSGMIFVTEGLLSRLGSEAELAAVIAHEMSHQLLGHTREAINDQGGEQKDNPAFFYSLDREIEADRLSLKLLKISRYDLRHAASALSIGYQEHSETGFVVPPDWLSMRMAYMHQHIEEMGEFLPATGNSREFTKVKHQLFG
jgi:Zn-dependent protease with chaperone function